MASPLPSSRCGWHIRPCTSPTRRRARRPFEVRCGLLVWDCASASSLKLRRRLVVPRSDSDGNVSWWNSLEIDALCAFEVPDPWKVCSRCLHGVSERLRVSYTEMLQSQIQTVLHNGLRSHARVAFRCAHAVHGPSFWGLYRASSCFR